MTHLRATILIHRDIAVDPRDGAELELHVAAVRPVKRTVRGSECVQVPQVCIGNDR